MLAHYEYDLLKAPAGRIETALATGSVIHKAFEALLIGKDWSAAAAEYLTDLQKGIANDATAIAYQEVEEQWQAIRICIQKGWATPEDWEVIAVEQELELPVGKHVVVGRLDTVIGWNTGTWHLQHKSVPTNKNLAVYSEQQRTDWHECVYQRMLEQRFDNVAGTLLNCIRKVTMKTALVNPLTAFQSFFLARTDEEVDEALADLEQELNDIQAEQEGARRIIKNRSHCAGAYGNKLCAFKEVCDGSASIDDPERFVTLEPRYAPAAPDV